MKQKAKKSFNNPLLFVLILIIVLIVIMGLYFFETNFKLNTDLLLYYAGALIVIYIPIILLWILQFKRSKELEESSDLLQDSFLQKEEEIDSLIQKEKHFNKQLEEQTVLSDILNAVSKGKKEVNQISAFALERILTLSFLQGAKGAAVFIMNEENSLTQIAEKGLGELKNEFKSLEPGKCICQKPLESNNILHLNKDTENKSDLGNHICLPLKINEQLHGLLLLFIADNDKISDDEINILNKLSAVLAFALLEKRNLDELSSVKEMLSKKDKSFRQYETKFKQKSSEQDVLYQTILTQKKRAEQKNSELEKKAKEFDALSQNLFAQKIEQEQQKSETEQHAKELENKAKELEIKNQELFAQKLELEQKNFEVIANQKELEKKAKEAETLYQELFAQKMEIEQQKFETDQYALKLKDNAKTLEVKNQELFAQKLELEQKNLEDLESKKELEKKAKETEVLNQELFAQKMEIEQQKFETEQYAHEVANKAKELETKNQELFAQKMELEQKSFEDLEKQKELEKKARETEMLNQQLFAQKLEMEQQKFETEQYSYELEDKAKALETKNQELFAQKMELEQKNFEVLENQKQLEKKAKETEVLNQELFAQKMEIEQQKFETEQYALEIKNKAQDLETKNLELFSQKIELEQKNYEILENQKELEKKTKEIEEKNKAQERLNQELFAQKIAMEQRNQEIELYSQQMEELKDQAESALGSLHDSINYSKYIQDALLPGETALKQIFKSSDFFIYFSPKEVIGGDFYFAKKVNDYAIFAVADCTGHGIPGALITMLGMSFLDNYVSIKKVNTTGTLLNLIRKEIKHTFVSENSLVSKVGFDISLCAVNLKTNELQYSGAFNPLIIIRDNTIHEYKATRNPIGSYPVEKDFDTTYIQLEENDRIYLFSDGYIDQIGGSNDRKFSKKQFKNMLLEIHQFPMKTQQAYASKILEKWQGEQAQVDDITLMGINWTKK